MVIHKDFNRDRTDNQPGRLEKDFKPGYLPNDTKGNETENEINTNERLAVFGEDSSCLRIRN